MEITSVLVVIAAIGLLTLDQFADEVYGPVGRAVISFVSWGRYPTPSPGRLERVATGVTGLAVLLAGVVLVVWLISAVAS